MIELRDRGRQRRGREAEWESADGEERQGVSDETIFGWSPE